MTTPSGTIAVSDVNAEIGRTTTATTDLNFLNGYLKPSIRPGSPNLGSDRGLKYYQQNNAGNCNNSNVNNCNCNCGNKNCTAGANCVAVNCANCDTQKWLQTGDCNVGANPVYNCTSNQNCYSYNCDCACACSKIICTELHKQKKLRMDIFQADQNFGQQLLEKSPDTYNGYRTWTEVVVDWMQGAGPDMMFWIKDPVERQQRITAFVNNWTEIIAIPWAEHMAYKMGILEQDNKVGKLLMSVGIPICFVVGKWQRVFGKSDKPAGWLKGASIIGICTVLRTVVAIGNLLGKKV